MRLSISILLEELSVLPIFVHKLVKFDIEQISFLNTHERNHSTLYIVEQASLTADLGYKCPKNLIYLGEDMPETLLAYTDTLIQITGKIQLNELFQIIMDIFISYENWHQSLLLAIIKHKSIGEFLEIASQKISNPIALLDNSLSLIARAGQFLKSSEGTMWENIEKNGYVDTDFFTIEEQREYAMSYKTDEPIIGNLSADKEHTYVSIRIFIDSKLYGSLGSVGINSEFTDGQISVLQHIKECLKLYIKSNDTVMLMLGNQDAFIHNMLKGISVKESLVLYHINKFKWNINDHFYLINFMCPVSLENPVQTFSYINKINKLFPLSYITKYDNSIIMIFRREDYTIKDKTVSEPFIKLLINNEMKCGISSCFDNFMNLKYYYIQSIIALESSIEDCTIIQYYEECHIEQIIKLLKNTLDLKSICHPAVLSMWEKQEESSHELIQCLYSYLINGRNLASASRDLYLHRNTLIYRLNKISKIWKIDYNILSPNELLYLIFSCKLVEYL